MVFVLLSMRAILKPYRQCNISPTSTKQAGGRLFLIFYFFLPVVLYGCYALSTTNKWTYFAASLRSTTFLILPCPSLKIVLLATVNVPFLVMKSGKHLWRTDGTAKNDEKIKIPLNFKVFISCWGHALCLSARLSSRPKFLRGDKQQLSKGFVSFCASFVDMERIQWPSQPWKRHFLSFYLLFYSQCLH